MEDWSKMKADDLRLLKRKKKIAIRHLMRDVKDLWDDIDTIDMFIDIATEIDKMKGGNLSE